MKGFYKWEGCKGKLTLQGNPSPPSTSMEKCLKLRGNVKKLIRERRNLKERGEKKYSF